MNHRDEILLYLAKDTKFDFELKDIRGKSTYDYISDQDLKNEIKSFRLKKVKRSSFNS